MSEAPAGGAKHVVGTVEVLKDEHTRMWYSAQVLDTKPGEKLLVGFDGKIWPNQEFPYSKVRKPMRQTQADLDKFNPRVGEEVDLRVNATEHQPAAWGAAVVKNIKHGFYFVTRSTNGGGHDAQSEAIVEKSMLRPTLAGGCLDADGGGVSMKMDSFKIAPGLRDWVTTDDAAGCLARIEADSGLMFIKVGRNELKLFGDDKSAQRAKMLLDVHQKHQIQIQTFQEMREKRLSALEKRRNRIEGTGYKHSIEIQIDPSFVKRVIGAKGEAIRAVMAQYEVNIHIPDEDESSPTRTVRIFGNSLENIEKARGEVEFVEEVYPEAIDPSMINWIRGRGDKTLKLFKELTGIVYARVDKDSQQMVICGTRNAVENAIAMFETHMMYFPVFSQMDEEMDQLVAQLEEYGDHQARRDWGWYRDDEGGEDGYAGGKSSGSKGAGKGKNQGKDQGKNHGKQEWKDPYWKDQSEDWWGDDWNSWEEEPRKGNKGSKNGSKGDSKGASKGDSKGAGKAGKGGGRNKGWGDDEEEHTKVATQPAKNGKSGGKGGKAAGRWQDEEAEEEEASEEEPAPRARGRGKAGGRGQTRAVYIEKKQADEPDAPAAKPAAKAGATKKMGKNGLRS